MGDETDGVDADDALVEYDTITEDDLYDIRTEAEHTGIQSVAALAEKERRLVLKYDDYVPMFSHDQAVRIGLGLQEAKGVRAREGRTDRTSLIDEICGRFLDAAGDDFEDETGVDEVV